MDSKRFVRYSFLIFCLLWIIILIADIIFIMHGKSICPTNACKVAETYVIGGKNIFQIAGIIFLTSLFILFFLYVKKNLAIFENLLYLSILSALSFDGVLIGYLYKMHTFCILCIAFAFSLILILTLFSIYVNKKNFILLGLGIWISSFIALNLLKFDVTTIKPPTINSSVMIHVKAKNKPDYRADLFVSLHCIHCFDVLYNLAKQKTFDNIEWRIHFLGGTKEDIMRISHILKDPNLNKDPFGTIIKFILAKKIKEIEPLEGVKRKLNESRKYFVYKGFAGIPVLIVRSGWYEIKVLGDKNIGRFLLEKGIVDKWYLIRAK
ncbi:hypothetical protein [Desulfothermus sp.]